MWRALCLVLILAAQPSFAQDREATLADIRQQLSVLFVTIQRLKRELSTTGSPSVTLGGTTALERIDSIEAELTRLTAATEALDNRINSIVVDGTNRIGDLEFRLVELEGGDLGALGETSTLGGGDALPPLAALPPPTAPTTELAVGERADFDAAKAAFDAGAFSEAAAQFERFTQAYTGGPLTAQAHFWRGQALSSLGSVDAAARSYLDSFSSDPAGMKAGDALYQLGLSLNALGQRDEACLMLGEVLGRFAGSAAAAEAEAARASLSCL